MSILQELVLQSNQRHVGVIMAATLLSAYALYRLMSKDSTSNCPMVPYTNPMFGSTEEYKKDPAAFLRKWTATLGPVYRMHVFGRPHTVISGSYVDEILFNSNFNFAEAVAEQTGLRMVFDTSDDHFSAEDFRDVIVKSLATRTNKSLPHMLNYLTTGLQEALGDLKNPRIFDNIFSSVQHTVVKAIASIFVGEELCENVELFETFKNVTTDIGSELHVNSGWLDYFKTINRIRRQFIGKYSPRVKKHKRQLLQSMAPEIERRLQGLAGDDPSWTRPDDILQDIIEKYTPPPSCPSDIYTYYINWIVSLIFSSVHTTTEHTTIVLYRLLQQPEVIDELLQEQNEALGDSDVFTGEIIRKLVKLDSVCRETFRLKNNFLMLPHKNTADENITLSNGVVIKPGDIVFLNIWTNHRDSSLQNDIHGNHDKFEPFRFVNTDLSATKPGNGFLVFGNGKHACPGRWFALYVIKMIVSLLIRDYKLTPCGPIVFPTGTLTSIPMGKVAIQRKLY